MDEMNFYTKTVKFTKLSKDKEFELLKQYHETKCPKIKSELFTASARYVVHVASQYKYFGPFVDIVSEGNIGLLLAIDKYDTTLPNPPLLITFADMYIREYIREYIHNNSSQVKFGRSKFNKTLIGIVSANDKIYNQLDGTINMAEAKNIAKKYSKKIDDVLYVCNYLHATTPNETIDGEYVSEVYQPFSDECYEYVNMIDTYSLNKKLAETINTKLDARSKDIIISRWARDEKLTLSELSKKHGVSMERIRQIENESITTLKNNLTPFWDGV